MISRTRAIQAHMSRMKLSDEQKCQRREQLRVHAAVEGMDVVCASLSGSLSVPASTPDPFPRLSGLWRTILLDSYIQYIVLYGTLTAPSLS